MVILISGSTHTGKTFLAQKLLEKYKYPYLSIDHLKMGLIRSKNTMLSVNDDDKLTNYLWPIVREIIKTAIENKQNLIIEGVYIPFDYKKSFTTKYLQEIKDYFLIFTEAYIKNNFEIIKQKANVIEKRKDDSCLNQQELIKENNDNLKLAIKNKCNYFLIDTKYDLRRILYE